MRHVIREHATSPDKLKDGIWVYSEEDYIEVLSWSCSIPDITNMISGCFSTYTALPDETSWETLYDLTLRSQEYVVKVYKIYITNQYACYNDKHDIQYNYEFKGFILI